MTQEGLGTYALLSRLGFPRSYRGKIMLVAFLGTHAPLIALVFYLLLGSSLGLGPALRILALMVVVTLVGTAATLLVLRGLLAPISLTSSALKGYVDDRQVPDLPTGFTDEAGQLMSDLRKPPLAQQVRRAEWTSCYERTGLRWRSRSLFVTAPSDK